MADSQTISAAVVAHVAAAEPVSTGQMFGKPCAKVAGKAFIARQGDTLAFKLDNDVRSTALQQPGAALWDTSGKERPMREWVAIPAQADADWGALAQSARDFVVNAGLRA